MPSHQSAVVQVDPMQDDPVALLNALDPGLRQLSDCGRYSMAGDSPRLIEHRVSPLPGAVAELDVFPIIGGKQLFKSSQIDELIPIEH